METSVTQSGPSLETFYQRLQRQMLGLDPKVRLDADLRLARLDLEAGAVLYREGQEEEHLFILDEGWAIAVSYLAGGSRFVHRIYQAGDMIGLEDTSWGYATSTVLAVTSSRYARMKKFDHLRFFATTRPLGAALHGIAMIDQVVMMDIARATARLQASARVAHLLLQIEARQQLTAPAEDASFECPLTQRHIADAVGLSLVQTNKSLRELRMREMITRTATGYRIERRDEMIGLAGFVNRYEITGTPPVALKAG